MPSPRSLRPIIFPSAGHLPPSPRRLLYSPIIHQHHHRRTTTTLRPSAKSQFYAFFAGIATTFGAALWLRPQRSTNAITPTPSQLKGLYALVVERFVVPALNKAFHEHLGCQNFQHEMIPETTSSNAPDDSVANFADIQMGVFLDADAASENIKGKVIGFTLSSEAREEMELVYLLPKILKSWDSEGLLRREGKAVCAISGKGSDGIWIYEEEGVEVEGADFQVRGEGGWLSRILSLEKTLKHERVALT